MRAFLWGSKRKLRRELAAVESAPRVRLNWPRIWGRRARAEGPATYRAFIQINLGPR